MKNIKDITISIFAIIGFVAILSSFNNQPQSQTNYGTPESHIWEMYGAEGNSGFLLNKKTGEIRLLDANRKEVIKCKVIDKSN